MAEENSKVEDEEEIALFKPRSFLCRSHFILALLIIGTLVVLTRLFHLHILRTHFLQAQGNARTIRVIDIPTYRGHIVDRRGEPLAVSTAEDAVWVDRRFFKPDTTTLTTLSQLLGLDSTQLQARLLEQQHRHFLYLKRDLSPELSTKVAAMNLEGLGIHRQYRRYYPAGPDCAQLIGFTDIDDHGQSGLELNFESWLKPTPGKKRVLEDRSGRWVQDLEELQIARAGSDLQLSIDLRIQSLALRELLQALERYKAKSATLVMIDIQTGEILAMVSAPSFNPNKRQERIGPFTRNRAVTDQFEPGSTLKPFTILMGLESGKFSPNTIIDTHPGYFFIQEHKVRDLHNYGSLSLTEILLKSSNVGVSRIALSLSSEYFLKSLTRFGFGQPLLLGFPGESSGQLKKHTKLDPFSRAAMSFGYGLALTPVHLAWGYATLGAQGVQRPLSLQRVDHPVAGKQIVPAEMATTLLDMLAQVTERGTGRRAQIPGYRTAGKTGTVRITEGRGYSEHRHIALFAGITPVKNPRLSTVVIIEEPQEGDTYYGGLSAAPVYAKVVGRALRLLNVAPDNLLTAATGKH